MVNRPQLIHAVAYFASHTRHCGKIKLFKLLFLLDFKHFSQTGKSVTGYAYQAWKFGPVPVELMEEWECLENDLTDAIHIEDERVFGQQSRQTVKVNDGFPFDPDEFSPRQLRLMRTLADTYRDHNAADMVAVTHAPESPWSRVWKEGAGDRTDIPYTLAIPDDDVHKDDLLQVAEEQAMYQAARCVEKQKSPIEV